MRQKAEIFLVKILENEGMSLTGGCQNTIKNGGFQSVINSNHIKDRECFEIRKSYAF